MSKETLLFFVFLKTCLRWIKITWLIFNCNYVFGLSLDTFEKCISYQKQKCSSWKNFILLRPKKLAVSVPFNWYPKLFFQTSFWTWIICEFAWTETNSDTWPATEVTHTEDKIILQSQFIPYCFMTHYWSQPHDGILCHYGQLASYCEASVIAKGPLVVWRYSNSENLCWYS